MVTGAGRKFTIKDTHRGLYYEDVPTSIQSDPAYQTNLEWGKPRSGHPEGFIRKHIVELEDNLDRLNPRLSGEVTALGDCST